MRKLTLLKRTLAVFAAAVMGVSNISFTVVAEGEYTYGDIDGNGSIDLADAAAILGEYAAIASSNATSFDERMTAAADVDGDSSITINDASAILSFYAAFSASLDPQPSDYFAVLNDVPELGTPDGTLGEGGDALTIICWTESDLSYMYDVVAEQSGIDKSKIVYKNVGANSTDANEKYAQIFASDEDVDLYFCDADWNMAYQNNDKYSAPLSAVGITEDMYANAYNYTIDMGKDKNGVLKGAAWQVYAGGYVYRADLAEQYLGITTPEDMQAKISDWDAFWATAAEVYTASKGVTAMADSLNGVWKAYSNGSRKTAWVQNGKITADTVTSSIGDFISMAKSNYDAGYISTAAQWTDGWLTQGMSTGDYANGTFGFFFPTWTIGANSLLSQAQGAEGAEYGMYNICEGPTSWFWGGSWICVSPKTDNATEAGKFIYAMTVDPVSMRAYADAKGDLVNNKDVMAEIVAEGTNSNPLLGGQDQFAILADSAANIDMSIATQYDSTINTELQIALQAYCKGTITSEEGCVDEFLDMLAEELTDVIVE